MTLLGLIILLVIAGVCGSLGAGIGGYSRTGWIGSVILGFIGAVFGMWIARQLTLPQVFVVQIGGVAFPVVWSVVGAAVFVAILGLFRGRRSD